MKGFPAKHTKLEIPHRSLMHHSSCDTYIPICLHTYLLINTYTYICLHIQTHVCLAIYIAKGIHLYSIYTYTYIHVYIHTFNHNYICMCVIIVCTQYICRYMLMHVYICLYTYTCIFAHMHVIFLCMYKHVYISTDIHMLHRGGLGQFISHICALGIPLPQQKQLSLIWTTFIEDIALF